MAYSNRGNAFDDKKDYVHAIADFDAAIKIDPRYATAFYNRANAKLNAGDKPGAIEDYREAVTLRPGFRMPPTCSSSLARSNRRAAATALPRTTSASASPVQRLHRLGVHAVVAGGDDAAAVVRAAIIPGGDDAAGAFDDGDQAATRRMA